jgi:hypothetical protein
MSQYCSMTLCRKNCIAYLQIAVSPSTYYSLIQFNISIQMQLSLTLQIYKFTAYTFIET